MLLGFARKKLGDVVFYRSSGEQISRARNRNPRNPRSEKQAVQRMVLATSSKMASAYLPLVNHSWEGIAVGQPSVQEFRRNAMNVLRSAARVAFNDPDAPQVVADYDIKGAPTIGAVQYLQISRGRLGLNSFAALENGGFLRIASALGNITSQTEYAAELAKLGIEPGDQLTFVAQGVDLSAKVATFTDLSGRTVDNYAQTVKYCRVVFVPTLPENFSGTLIADGAFNPALIERTEGVLPAVTEGTVGTLGLGLSLTWASEFDGETTGVMLFGVIRSKLDGSQYRYSSCFMQANATFFDFNNASDVYPSYMDGAGAINVGDNLYLRNAVAAPFAAGV